MREAFLALVAAVLVFAAATPVWGHGGAPTSDAPDSMAMEQLDQVERITKRYQTAGQAKRAGFVPFAIPEEIGGTLVEIRGDEVTCFDSPDGGMGVHYVRNIDDLVSPDDPEALVYSIGRFGRLRLVAVEYIIPTSYVDPANPPVVLGQQMHPHSYLPVYVLHAWVHKSNPSGVFADFNPSVGACPTG